MLSAWHEIRSRGLNVQFNNGLSEYGGERDNVPCRYHENTYFAFFISLILVGAGRAGAEREFLCLATDGSNPQNNKGYRMRKNSVFDRVFRVDKSLAEITRIAGIKVLKYKESEASWSSVNIE